MLILKIHDSGLSENGEHLETQEKSRIKSLKRGQMKQLFQI